MSGLIIRTQKSGKRISIFLVLLISTGILFEYLPGPAPLLSTIQSEFYESIANEDNYALFNLPIDSQKSKQYMFAQTIHNHPILQGKTARFPEGTYAFIDGNPWLRTLRQYDEMTPQLPNVGSQLRVLADNKVEYLVLHKTLASPDRLAHWERYLMISPRYEDKWIAVYSTEPVENQDYRVKAELVPGIGIIKEVTSTNCIEPGSVWAVDIGWRIKEPAVGTIACLSLITEKGQVAYKELFDDSDYLLPDNDISWRYYTLHTPESLSTGEYTVSLNLVDAVTGERKGSSFSLGRLSNGPALCDYSIPDGVQVNALFGDELRLLGYDSVQENDLYKITLYWRSEQRMELDYKMFVHVFDPQTGIPVVQNDAMPRQWGYPTTFWGIGERVDDKIPILLEDLPAGEYGVAVGVYDPLTMNRLPISDSTGNTFPDGRFVLTGEKVIND